MFNTTSGFALVGALVSAGAYARPLPSSAHAPVPMQIMENIQRARVDIYCGHRQQAVADIRTARRQLRASGATVSPETLAALDEAAWRTGHHQHALAEKSLDAALDRIAADAAMS